VHALFGLGNPGSEYDGTRHNIGFSIVDALCEEFSIRLRPGKGDYLVGTASYRGTECCLVKPLTYMNNSGIAVQDVVGRQRLRLEDILIMCDDFQLPLGKLRTRPGGSDGGHNGLYSVMVHLGTHNFPRLRCGIAGPPEMPARKSEMAKFVLTVFTRNELPVVHQMVNRARDAALTFLSEGLTTAMNKFNTSV